MNHLSLRQAFHQHMAQTTPAPLGIAVDHAQGNYLYDADGKAYLDLIAGIAVSALGHGHPAPQDAIVQQLKQHTHVMVYGEFVLAPQVAYATALVQSLNALDCVYFTNSGSEAVEGAMKLAKRVLGRKGFVCFQGAYHGSTQGALSLAGDPALQENYTPLLPHVQCIAIKEEALSAITHDTAAVFIEPVQGEAGVQALTPTFARALAKRCAEVGAWLVVDESQTGLGRTGHLWGHQAFDWQPDVLIAAKALGGGLPLGAFIARKAHMQALTNNPALGHISTFGGHPLSCAAGLATWEVIRAQQLWHHARTLGDAFAAGIRRLNIGEVRHAGLLMAWDVHDATKAQRLIAACLEQGVVVDGFLFAPTAVRIAPPLVLTTEDMAVGLARIEQAAKLL